MNSMELVRFPTRFPRSPERPQKQNLSPPFAAELTGLVRNAIVCARHSLISQQRYDGTWWNLQPSDVSLLSRLVLLEVYRGREDSELARHCLATIEYHQLPNGGWSATSGDTIDVSTSVQAYFALKLAGYDPTDERMRQARQVIRRLGGADTADGETRYLLAFFGQIGYDQCPPMPPRSALRGKSKSPLEIAMSITWSQRPVRHVPMERGIRELFMQQPSGWPANATAQTKWKSGGRIQRSIGDVIRAAAGQHSIAGQRRALARHQQLLLEQVQPDHISGLNPHELIWHRVALHAMGYSCDSPEQMACADAIEKGLHVDEDSGLICPNVRAAALAGTALAVRSLVESGMSFSHAAIEDGLHSIRQAIAEPAVATTANTNAWANYLQGLNAIEDEAHSALPPDLDIRWNWQYSHGETSQEKDDRCDVRTRAAASCEFHLREAQSSDGSWGTAHTGWNSHTTSDPLATGEALEPLSQSNNKQVLAACELGCRFLLESQRGDGSWTMPDGSQPVACTAAAIRGLLSAGHDSSSEQITAAINWLVVEQQQTGAWNDSVQQTAQAVLGLIAAGAAENLVVCRAIHYLTKSQREDGAWNSQQNSSPVASSDGDSIEHTCWALLALSRFLLATNPLQPEVTIHLTPKLATIGDDS